MPELNGQRQYHLRTKQPSPFKRVLLRSVECGFQVTGLAAAIGRFSQTAGAIILVYHSVPAPPLSPWIDPANALDPAMFADHMAFLARRRTVLSMSDLLRVLESGRTIDRGTVVITFDDGYLDVLEVAAPILARHSLPATIYLPTGCISRVEPPWIDTLYNAFTSRTIHSLHVPDAGLAPTSLDADGSDIRAYRHLTSQLIIADLPTRGRILNAVCTQLKPAATPPRITLTWDDVRRLRDRFPSFEFGAHTVDHVDLTACAPQDLRRQTAGAAAEAARELGRPPQHFACPYGRCTPAISRILGECGYRSVVADGDRPLISAGADRLCLNRMNVTSLTRLGYFTSGAYPCLSRLLCGHA